MTQPPIKEDDWITCPNSEELVGPDLPNNTPMKVTQVNEDGSVRAWGVQWEVGEFQPCASPLYRVGKKQGKVILTGSGLVVAYVQEGYQHLIPTILKALNQDFQ